MSVQILVVIVLNAIISLIGTLAYSVRLVGVRTGKIAISYALFNILMLVSRVALTFQAPLLTKYVEGNPTESLRSIFYWIILASGVATIIGAFLIPTFQRVFAKGVTFFNTQRSVPKLMMHAFTKAGVTHIRECVAIPVKESLSNVRLDRLPKRILLLNTIAVAIITAGAFAPIYAGSLAYEFRATCMTLSPVINGFATILMTLFIDPHLSMMTDDVVGGTCSPQEFRSVVVGMVASKTAGTFLAVLLLIPAAHAIAFIARVI